ncbi:MAG TPA: histidine kinase dimerization/phosphoacceptor domain -containing protein, partial [Alphaproteobacteria bacterium]|nr:histidine kinase dimerization/phosphoacceptor domain -containing protein [Alphaproteobacteria bacterium]
GLDGGNPLVLTVPVKHTDRRADATVHLHDGRLILELEPAADRAEDFSNLTARALQRAVATLRDTQGREALAALTVRQVRAITGYERVLIYRFDDEWNGEVIAEDRVEDWAQSFMGMHFPATDIPAQARALYTRNPCRSVAQRDYVPVPLLAADARPVDLTFARLRSLSPVHLEYHRNMGVDGSASFSILKDGRLWGLLVAHHRRPHHCPPDLRGAAAILVNAFAMRLDDVESAAFWESRQRHQEDQARLLEQMATSDDFAAALTRGAVPLHRLFGAGGAAVLHRGRLATCGEVPPEDDIRALAARLGRQGGGAIFATDRLEAVHPPMAAHRAGASGLLAAFLDPQRQDMLLWFRPEWPRTIVWSGDPENAMRREGEGEGAILLPRRNFERWVELRRGQAEPLPRWALEVAETLRHAVAEVVIRHEARIGTLAATLARVEQALHEVTHRVKNSLQVVSSLLQLQARRAGGEAQAALVTARGRVAAIAQVHRHLYTSGSLDSVPLAPYLQSLCRDLAGSQGNGCKVTVEADPEAMLATDKAVTFGLLVAELVANACRHAYAGEGGPVEVGLSPRSSGEGWRLTIADRGRGNAELLRRPPGDGLGLKLVPGLVDQLKARLVFEDRAPGVAAVVEW